MNKVEEKQTFAPKEEIEEKVVGKKFRITRYFGLGGKTFSEERLF